MALPSPARWGRCRFGSWPNGRSVLAQDALVASKRTLIEIHNIRAPLAPDADRMQTNLLRSPSLERFGYLLVLTVNQPLIPTLLRPPALPASVLELVLDLGSGTIEIPMFPRCSLSCEVSPSAKQCESQ